MSCSRAAIINISSILGSIAAAEAWEERQDVSYRCSKVLPWSEWGGIWGAGVSSCGILPHHQPWQCHFMMVAMGFAPPCRLL